MRLEREDTIFAVATGSGRHAISVVRISGPAARLAFGDPLPAPRRATLRVLRDPRSSDVIDRALVLWMPGPGTSTGEDVAEWHLHGGPAVRSAALAALAAIPGYRPAEPGEFTRRGFLNGRLDLAVAEGLADLIDAETDAQRRQALRHVEGALGHRIGSWRDALLDVLATLDSSLDFSDEADVPEDVTRDLIHTVERLAADITREVVRGRRGERLREGFVAVIAGPPNAGKSSLLNALARRDVAIVSPVPGTTRDAIELRCDLDGLPVTFVDTAGLRDSADLVERIGIGRTRALLRNADLVLWLTEAGSAAPPPDELVDRIVLSVSTKQDSAPHTDDGALRISAMNGTGLDRLLDAVTDEARRSFAGGADALVVRERHRQALSGLTDALDRATSRLREGRDELAAEDIRLGLRALGRVTGEVDVDDVLNRIFSRFCIGK